jgi:prophage regulatory protein
MMKILRFKELSKILNISRSSLARWEEDGVFPKRIPLGKNSVGWDEQEVLEWIENKKNQEKNRTIK